jgi:hypothetical protein
VFLYNKFGFGDLGSCCGDLSPVLVGIHLLLLLLLLNYYYNYNLIELNYCSIQIIFPSAKLSPHKNLFRLFISLLVGIVVVAVVVVAVVVVIAVVIMQQYLQLHFQLSLMLLFCKQLFIFCTFFVIFV